MIQERLQKVQQAIIDTCQSCGRNPSEVTLIAVSKTKPIEMVQDVYDCGVRDFGENKVQEIDVKQPALPDDIRWHMIGHLQRNKVKDVIGKVCLIHSVDSLRLAEAISREAVKQGLNISILLEVNVAGEETKGGFSPDEVCDIVQQIAELPGIAIKGLMTIAPFVDDPEENRPVFRKLWQLSVDIKEKITNNVTMNVLSMGMTNDYRVAIEEGATCVRVGTAIFGERDYSNKKIGE